jgi:hypothetical protein
VGWTLEEYEEFCRRRGVSAAEGLKLGVITLAAVSDENRTKIGLRAAKLESAAQLALGKEGGGEEVGSVGADWRVGVEIEISRTHLCDEDNNYGSAKQVVDCLRLSGLIRGDSPKQINLTVTQKKARTKKETGTKVTLTYPDNP